MQSAAGKNSRHHSPQSGSAPALRSPRLHAVRPWLHLHEEAWRGSSKRRPARDRVEPQVRSAALNDKSRVQTLVTIPRNAMPAGAYYRRALAMYGTDDGVDSDADFVDEDLRCGDGCECGFTIAHNRAAAKLGGLPGVLPIPKRACGLSACHAVTSRHHCSVRALGERHSRTAVRIVQHIPIPVAKFPGVPSTL